MLSNTNVSEASKEERAKTKWEFHQLTEITFFAALLREVPMGCTDAILPERLARNHTVSCLAYDGKTREKYKDNLRLFRALVLELHEKGGGLEEEISKLFKVLL